MNICILPLFLKKLLPFISKEALKRSFSARICLFGFLVDYVVYTGFEGSGNYTVGQ
jgi:hypothetical protein